MWVTKQFLVPIDVYSMEKEIHADLEQLSKHFFFGWTVPLKSVMKTFSCFVLQNYLYSDIKYELEADVSFWKQLLY